MRRNLQFALIVLFASLFMMPAAQAVSYELTPSSRVILQVNPGMTIDVIVQRLYPTHKDIWSDIKKKLVALNPESFQPYSDVLLQGARLKLIDVKRIHEKVLASKTRVGYVSGISGSASAGDINGISQALQMNSQIFEGDRISTERGASLSVYMNDGAEVYLKEDSVLKITEYIITSGFGKKSSSIFDLLRGGLRKISGAIGNSALANYQVQTGLATIGIRGTEYVIKLCKQDDCTQTVSRNDPEAKLHAVVLDGIITLTTDEEVQILMAIGEYGTASTEVLQIEEVAAVPAGFLDAEETHKFEVTIPQMIEKQKEEESSNGWMWWGLLLLAVGL
ncbi:MAG: hypothetical protein ACI9LO_002354 [Planctomycetota bacterium]|jgi:hypothetical protein